VARRDREAFDCATWLHKARELPKEGFKGEVERYLTGKETEGWDLIYFKLYKSQIPVVEKALGTAGLMLGTDKSRGYCLEMTCADFLAGATLERHNNRFDYAKVDESDAFTSKATQLRLRPEEYTNLRIRVLERDGWRCQECGSMEGLEVHHMKRTSQLGGDSFAKTRSVARLGHSWKSVKEL
jgi:hypothetical protein